METLNIKYQSGVRSYKRRIIEAVANSKIVRLDCYNGTKLYAVSADTWSTPYHATSETQTGDIMTAAMDVGVIISNGRGRAVIMHESSPWVDSLIESAVAKQPAADKVDADEPVESLAPIRHSIDALHTITCELDDEYERMASADGVRATARALLVGAILDDMQAHIDGIRAQL